MQCMQGCVQSCQGWEVFLFTDSSAAPLQLHPAHLQHRRGQLLLLLLLAEGGEQTSSSAVLCLRLQDAPHLCNNRRSKISNPQLEVKAP